MQTCESIYVSLSAESRTKRAGSYMHYNSDFANGGARDYIVIRVVMILTKSIVWCSDKNAGLETKAL